MTLRQLHYAIFSTAKIDYDNTPEDYDRLAAPPPRLAELARRQKRRCAPASK
jgi:hypothetical protein